jgi:hypothetical protein
MPSNGTIGGLVGKLLVLRLECSTCGRQGRYHVARLLAKLGAAARLTDWLNERTADCPQKNQAGVTRACGAAMPDLVDLAVKEIVLVTLAVDTETGRIDAKAPFMVNSRRR